MHTTARVRNLVVALSVLVFCVVQVLWLIPDFIQSMPGGRGLGPRFYPYLLVCAMGGLAVMQAIACAIGTRQPEKPAPIDALQEVDEDDAPIDRHMVIGLVSFAVFFVVILAIGMLPAVFVSMLCYARAFQIRSWWKVLIFSVVTTAIFSFFFKTLVAVQFPSGLLEQCLPFHSA